MGVAKARLVIIVVLLAHVFGVLPPDLPQDHLRGKGGQGRVGGTSRRRCYASATQARPPVPPACRGCIAGIYPVHPEG
jgi:hypothetical protein